MLAKIESNLRFSIIIPLEFHRGQVEACLRRWAHEQTYSRDQYEIIAVGCRDSLEEATITFFKSLLNDEYDRLLLFDEPHDMALCAYGAKRAQGEILFFTESHVLPQEDLLSVVDQALHDHPEWAGFSCQSIRITPNRLSIVEADMYGADILYGMKEHPWRKILDQCFAVRVESYHRAGGFRPELGHFAEWHLAAQMHQKGYLIGYVPEAKVHHYYVGDINELIEFSRDFAHGEMIFYSEFIDDECRSYFTEPLEWLMYHQWHPRLYSIALQLSHNIYSKSLRNLNLYKIFILLRLLLELVFSPSLLTKLALIKTHIIFQFNRLILGFLLDFYPCQFLLHTIFIQLIDSTIRLERIQFIQNLTKKQLLVRPLSLLEPAFSLTWKPDSLPSYPSFGFHASEEWQSQKFRWSGPIGIVEVPLLPGNYQLQISWLPIRHIKNLILYINEKPIPSFYEGTTLKIFFEADSNSPTRFAWTCEPWLVPNDRRLLGIPIISIIIVPQE